VLLTEVFDVGVVASEHLLEGFKSAHL
jgi:hypothetical protein